MGKKSLTSRLAAGCAIGVALSKNRTLYVCLLLETLLRSLLLLRVLVLLPSVWLLILFTFSIFVLNML